MPLIGQQALIQLSGRSIGNGAGKSLFLSGLKSQILLLNFAFFLLKYVRDVFVF